jgi:pseudouridine kinase
VIEAVSVPKTAKIAALLGKGPPIYAVTPNMLQAQAMTGVRIEHPSDAFTAAKRIADMGVELVVITLGEQGVYVHSPDDSAHIPPFAVTGPVEVTGAGDAMTAGFIFGLALGLPALDAAQLGQAASSMTVASPDSVAADLNAASVLALARSRIGNVS